MGANQNEFNKKLKSFFDSYGFKNDDDQNSGNIKFHQFE